MQIENIFVIGLLWHAKLDNFVKRGAFQFYSYFDLHSLTDWTIFNRQNDNKPTLIASLYEWPHYTIV